MLLGLKVTSFLVEVAYGILEKILGIRFVYNVNKQ